MTKVTITGEDCAILVAIMGKYEACCDVGICTRLSVLDDKSREFLYMKLTKIAKDTGDSELNAKANAVKK
jgi:hypothetical protein